MIVKTSVLQHCCCPLINVKRVTLFTKIGKWLVLILLCNVYWSLAILTLLFLGYSKIKMTTMINNKIWCTRDDFWLLRVNSSPLNYGRITLLMLLQMKNNLELIKLSKIMINLCLKRLHVNYAKQGYKVSAIVNRKKIILIRF